jgi:aldehyde dehydrogenase (NAD+)
MREFGNYIDGEQRPARDGGWLESTDPSTGQVWARIPASGAADIDDAVAAASRAAEPWARTSPMQRAAMLRAWAGEIANHVESLSELETRDNGRALRETRMGDLPGSALLIHYVAGLADKVTGDTVQLSPQSLNYTVREPIGVVGVIIPWNAPLAMFFAKVSAALAAGNAVVVKPAEQASCSILAATAMLEKFGMPKGLVNVVAGDGPTAGDALVAHPGVGKISFTGSTDTARTITTRSVSNLKRLALELGGKSPNIVFADADLDAAAAGVAAGIYTGGAGQACIAGSRILVQAPIFAEFVERLRDHAEKLAVGDPMDLATAMGPIAFAEQYDKVRSYLESGPREGAELVFGGGTGTDVVPAGSPLAGGYFVAPTLYRVPSNALRICQEEIFGPVAVAMPFDTEDEAVAIANDTRYGLAAGIWTQNLTRAHRLAARIKAGSVWLNTYRRIHWAVPFGGLKESGNAPAGGVDALHEWMDLKSVWVELS